MTKYLAEVRPGDKIAVYGRDGVRAVCVGRVKKEKRPLWRLELENGVSATVQEGDSVHLEGPEGAVPFEILKEETVLLTYPEGPNGRHKGEKVEEYIEEW